MPSNLRPDNDLDDEPDSVAPAEPAAGQELHWTSWVLVALSLAAFGVGLGFCGDAQSDLKVWRRSQELPAELTLTQLAADGTPGNNHIRLTEYRFGKPVLRQNKDSPNGPPVWLFVPVLGSDGRQPATPVILAKYTPASAADIPQGGSIQGFVMPNNSGAHELATATCRPDASPERVVVINDSVRSWQGTRAAIAWGLGLQLLGVVLFRWFMVNNSRRGHRADGNVVPGGHAVGS